MNILYLRNYLHSFRGEVDGLFNSGTVTMMLVTPLVRLPWLLRVLVGM